MNADVRLRLGDVLLARGYLQAEQLEVALAEQKRVHRPLGEILVHLGFVRPEHVAAVMAEELGLEFVRAQAIQPDPVLLAAIETGFVRKASAFPIRLRGGVLEIAMAHPTDPEKLALVRERFPYPLAISVVTEGDLARLLREHKASTQSQVARLLKSAVGEARDGEASAEELTQALLEDGILRGATDIHIEPEEKLTRLRYRVDGVLQQGENLPRRVSDAVISRIKILSRLDIAERRRPQDGRMQASVDGRRVDLRVSLMPTSHGENLVLRILDRSGGSLQLEALGIDLRTRSLLEKVLRRPHGLVIVTGPTGSGKTTTLYAMLSKVDAIHCNVATIEDPIEYSLPLVRQSQVDLTIGYGFPEGLRALLRQDPDVILVGEIRDALTAEMAIKASMTGHLVFSTLHTNTAVGAVARLASLGIQPYLIEDTLVGVLAQRLVRRICDGCSEPIEPGPAELAWLQGRAGAPLRGKGCDLCGMQGYAGRTMISELFLPDDNVAHAIAGGVEPGELLRLAKLAGFREMIEDGREKVRAGITTVEEVQRSCRSLRLEASERAVL